MPLSAIIDTNVLVAGLITNNPRSANAAILMLQATLSVSPAIPRDRTDAKWLSLATQANADYLVTNDRRHLLRLRRFGRTRIVTPNAFLRELGDVPES